LPKYERERSGVPFVLFLPDIIAMASSSSFAELPRDSQLAIFEYLNSDDRERFETRFPVSFKTPSCSTFFGTDCT
jgi:hypothetical protein